MGHKTIRFIARVKTKKQFTATTTGTKAYFGQLREGKTTTPTDSEDTVNCGGACK
jgi:hypothetical protein